MIAGIVAINNPSFFLVVYFNNSKQETKTQKKQKTTITTTKGHAPSSDEPIALRRAHHTGFDDVSERIQVLLSSAHSERGDNGQSQVRLGC